MSFNELFGLGSHSEDASLEGWWPLQDDAASTAVVDTSGNGNDGTLNGGDNTADKATTGPNGYLSSAFALNGIDDSVSVADLGVKPNTVLCHVYLDSAASGTSQDFAGLVGFGSYKVRRTNDPGIATRAAAGSVLGPHIVSEDEWLHVGCTFDASGEGLHTLFVNGSGVDSDITPGGLIPSTDDFFVGVDPAGDRFLLGRVAGAALFSRMLTEAEVGEHYNGPEPVNSVAPALSGIETEDETLSVTTGTWGLDSPFSAGSNGTITYAYQWTRSDDGSGTNEADIGGATSNTYTLVTADVGKFIRCRVRATNDGGFDADADTNSDFTGEIQAAGGGGSAVPVFTQQHRRRRVG